MFFSTKECDNYQTIEFLSHASKVMLKILHARLQHFQTKNFQMSNRVQKRQRNQRSNCQHLLDHRESKGIPEKYLLVSLTTQKPLTV